MKNGFWVMLLVSSFLVSCLTGCGNKNNISAIYPENEEVVSLANAEVTDFVTNYEWGRGSYLSEAYYGKGDHYEMQGVTLRWEDKNQSKHFVVAVSENKDMSMATEYQVTGNEVEILDLFVNTTYYWQVTGGKGKSNVFSFQTAATPRTIVIDGVSNTRDLGGKVTESGKKIRQGAVYRGAKLDSITKEGKIAFLEKYQIKTDLDLRKHGEGLLGESPVGNEVSYYNYSCPYYTSLRTSETTGIDEEKNYENMASAMRVFADSDNYPVYFHCAIGRDRTSMVAMLLLGVCGVSKTDIYMDYEMSFFSESGCSDKASVEQMVNNFSVTINYIAQCGESHGTFQENCEAYLLQIGLTQTEIDAIRNNLIVQ